MPTLVLLSTAAIAHRPPHATGPATGRGSGPPRLIANELLTIYTPPVHSKIHANQTEVSLGPACRAPPLHAIICDAVVYMHKSHSIRQLALPPSSFLPVGVSHRGDATSPLALLTPSQTTLGGRLPSRLYAHSSHATITFDIEINSSRMNQPTVNPLRVGLRSWHSSTLHPIHIYYVPFALPPAPTRSQPPGLWRVVAYGL